MFGNAVTNTQSHSEITQLMPEYGQFDRSTASKLHSSIQQQSQHSFSMARDKY